MARTPNRTIRDYRFEAEKALVTRDALVAAEEAARGDRRVIPPYYPRRPIDAGDAMSTSGARVAFEELDADLQALLLSGGAIRVREVDGSPDVDPVDDIRVPSGSIVSVAGSTIQFLFADYVGSFELAAPGPGTGDIPEGRWGFWYDTTNGQQWLVRNRGGVLRCVELT